MISEKEKKKIISKYHMRPGDYRIKVRIIEA